MVINPYSVQGVVDSAHTEAEDAVVEAEDAVVETEDAVVDAPANSEERFHLAFDHNMAGTVLLDHENKVLEVNDAFCQMVGRNRDEIVGKYSELFTHPEDLGISEEAQRRLTSGEVDQVSYTKRYLHEDGQVIDVEVSKSAVRDAAGSTPYFVSSVRDVTEERALSAQLSHQALHDSLTGTRQPGAVRGPPLPGAREDSTPRRVERRDVVGPR